MILLVPTGREVVPSQLSGRGMVELQARLSPAALPGAKGKEGQA